MKTQDLTGPALDWAVAKCEKLSVYTELMGMSLSMYATYVDFSDDYCHVLYTPSVHWGWGGPIIEREGITVRHIGHSLDGQIWDAAYDEGDEVEADRPLIAAMRCYVASKLGDEVDIPEELR
jgi:hypothetical protein